MRDDPFGVLVKYGYTLFTDTANQIGPTVADLSRRFAGNNLACGNCHLQAGSQSYAMPLVVAISQTVVLGATSTIKPEQFATDSPLEESGFELSVPP